MSGPANQPKYRLSPEWTFRLVEPGSVEAGPRTANENREASILQLSAFELLLKFASPRTALDVFETYVDASEMDARSFQDIVEELAAAGLLEKDGPESEENVSLASWLRKDVFADPTAIERVGSHLRAGRLVMIPDAIDGEVAESVYASLRDCTAWRLHEGHEANFHFHHHNLYDSAEFPPALRGCHSVFASLSTRDFVQQLSGRPCGGVASFAASWYQPGDHSLPHKDAVDRREVAFVWHLTKDWDSTWGGHLVWCPTGTVIKPMFNCLHLFVVSDASLHFVSVVSSRAQGKRLAVNGWWNAPKNTKPQAPRVDGPSPEGGRQPSNLLSRHYGAEGIRIGDVFIV
jgi:hypothetical protein